MYIFVALNDVSSSGLRIKHDRNCGVVSAMSIANGEGLFARHKLYRRGEKIIFKRNLTIDRKDTNAGTGCSE